MTVEGVGVVVDAGLARRPFYDPASGLTRLRTMVASKASAEQRAGRAGRLGPGVAYRLWSQAEHATRRPWPDPEIVSTDLAGLALELAVWGAAPGELKWLNRPPTAALEIAQELLEELAQPMAAGPPRWAANCPPYPSIPGGEPCCSPPRRPPNAPPLCWPPCSPNGTSSAATRLGHHRRRGRPPGRSAP